MTVIAAGAAFLAAAVALRYLPAAVLGDRRALLAVAVLSAVVAAYAPGDPTGVSGVDLALRAGLGAAAVLAGAAAPWATAWAAVTACLALVAAWSDAATAAAGALGIVVAVGVAGIQAPVLSGLAAGSAAQAALRLDWPILNGASLALGVLIVAPLLLAGFRRAPRRARRRIGWAVGAVAAFCTIAGGGAAVAAIAAARDVQAATDFATRGLDLVGDDEQRAGEALLRAADRFEDANQVLDAWWARPARLVPFVAQQTRAVATMADSGADLSRTAAQALEDADVDSIRVRDGVVDLRRLVSVREPLDRTTDSLSVASDRLAGVGSPWLLPPVADRYHRLLDRVGDARTSAELAADVLEVAPRLLGADGARRYLLLVQQPAEARGSGGLPGNWGEIVADDGELDLLVLGRLDELIERQPPIQDRRVEVTPAFEALYGGGDLDVRWQNATLAPDFPTAAALTRQLWAQSGGAPIDGVLTVDPTTLAAVLDVVGPVELADGRRLTTENAERFLWHEQYVEFPDEPGEAEARVDLLGGVAELAWDELTSGELPGPRALAASFGPAVEGRHLQFVTFHDAENVVLTRLGLTGTIPEPVADGVGVTTVNAGLNKIDFFLERHARYVATWDPATGEVRGTYTVTFRNSAPPGGMPNAVLGWGGTVSFDPGLPTGTNLSQAYLHTALPPTAVRVDGQDVNAGPLRDDLGWFVLTLPVVVPPGGEVSVEIDVAGSIGARRAWRLDVVRQPAIGPDDLVVHLDLASGWEPADVVGAAIDGDAVRGRFDLSAPIRVFAGAQAPGPFGLRAR